MSQGSSRTLRTNDLSFIFFKLRETRCPKTRRSWQRRARLALALRIDLTPAERHEIACTWSQRNAHQIDSPAMSKLQGKRHAPRPEQTIQPKRFTRRNFTTKTIANQAINTPATDVKKPAFNGLAANDDAFICDPCTASRKRPNVVQSLEYQVIPCKIYDDVLLNHQAHDHEHLFLYGSEICPTLFHGNRFHPSRQREPVPPMPKLPLPRRMQL